MTMSRLRPLAVGAGVFLLAVLLASLPPYPKYVLILGLLNVIAAAGLSLVMGYAGLVSLGHAGFVAVGAYATVLLTSPAGLPFWVALPVGAILAGVVGFFIGLPTMRLPPLYLATVTWGFGQS